MNWFLRMLIGATVSAVVGGIIFAVLLVAVNALGEGGDAVNPYVVVVSTFYGLMYGALFGAIIGGTTSLCPPGRKSGALAGSIYGGALALFYLLDSQDSAHVALGVVLVLVCVLVGVSASVALEYASDDEVA